MATTNTTDQPMTTAQQAAAADPAAWYQLVRRVEDAQQVLVAFAGRDDLTGGRDVVDHLAEQIEAGRRHDNRRFGERHPVRPGQQRSSYFERPCCDHVARAEAEAAELRREVADLRAALAVADAALEQYRR